MLRVPDGPPVRRTPYLVIAMAALLLSLAALGLRRAGGPAPSLDAVRALARSQKFDRARSLLEGYLRTYPEDSRAHLLMAQLATEPPDPRPDLALEHLAAVRPRDPRQAALVRFFEGKAQYQRARFDLTESAWKDALRLDPSVPEAGWALIDLLDKEGRVEEAHRLGMRLHHREPDPRDRVKILLEMSRLDIDQVSPGSQVQLFEPLVREHPENLPLSLTVGLALVRDSRGEQGVEFLESVLEQAPGLARGLGRVADGPLRGLPVRSAGGGVRAGTPVHGRRCPIRQTRGHDRPECEGLAPGGAGLSPRGGPRAVQRDLDVPAPGRAAIHVGCRGAGAREPVVYIVRRGIQAVAAGVPGGAGGPDDRPGAAPGAVSAAGRPPRADGAAPTRPGPGINWCSATTPPTRSAGRPSSVSGRGRRCEEMDCGLQITDYRLQITDYRLQSCPTRT